MTTTAVTTTEDSARRPPSRRGGRGARGSALVGAAALLVSLLTIWGARLWVAEDVYVSQLGADGMPTAGIFNTALLLLAAGGVLAGLGLRGVRATVPVLSRWSVTTTLLTAGAAFGVASQVTCTAGCPVPLTPAATVQDLVHVVAAVLGFAAATWAMLQVGWSTMPRPVRTASRAAAVAVGAAAATGGLLSVAQLGTDVGAGLEFLATTVATSWLAALAAWASRQTRGVVGAERAAAAPRPATPTRAARPCSARSSAARPCGARPATPGTPTPRRARAAGAAAGRACSGRTARSGRRAIRELSGLPPAPHHP